MLLHAGGAAIAGRWLYVAGTDWLYVFNLDHFVQEGDGPYQLPVRARYAIADEADRDRHNPFSSISVDGSGPEPRLVAAEYRLPRGDEALVTAWPLEKDGRLPAADPDIRSVRAWTIDGDSQIDNVQGVAAAGDLFLFAESSNEIERVRVGTPRGGGRPVHQVGRGHRRGPLRLREPRHGRRDQRGLPGHGVGVLGGVLPAGVRPRRRPPKGYPDHDC